VRASFSSSVRVRSTIPLPRPVPSPAGRVDKGAREEGVAPPNFKVRALAA
jgi:hypothetical protein